VRIFGPIVFRIVFAITIEIVNMINAPVTYMQIYQVARELIDE
jgi:hypothetical protein